MLKLGGREREREGERERGKEGGPSSSADAGERAESCFVLY